MTEDTTTDIMIIEPARAIARAKQHSDIVRLMRKDKILHPGADYGIIPGTKKPTLFKPGAERLCTAFGFSPDFELVNSIEDWDDEKPMFHYQWKCKLIHIESGKLIASGVGSCNSMESKYRWRWLWPNETNGMDTSDMATRKRGNKTQYRIPNDDVFSIVNTIDKMAQKRALIAAVLIGCNASDHFTQDIEDMPSFGTEDVVDAEFTEVEPTAPTMPTSTPNGDKPPIVTAWPVDRIDKLFAHWIDKGLSESDILRFAGIADKYSEQWNKYASNQDASGAIQRAHNAEMDGGNTSNVSNSADRSAVYKCEFTHMNYAATSPMHVGFANGDPLEHGGLPSFVIAKAFGRSTTLKAMIGDDDYDELDLARYDDVKKTTMFVEMPIKVEFEYTKEIVQKGKYKGEEYNKIVGVVGSDPSF